MSSVTGRKFFTSPVTVSPRGACGRDDAASGDSFVAGLGGRSGSAVGDGAPVGRSPNATDPIGTAVVAVNGAGPGTAPFACRMYVVMARYVSVGRVALPGGIVVEMYSNSSRVLR